MFIPLTEKGNLKLDKGGFVMEKHLIFVQENGVQGL
jgi:hypothetical protein